MKKFGIILFLMATPAYAQEHEEPRPEHGALESYEGQCSIKQNEAECYAKEWVRFGNCILKAEQKFIKNVQTVGFNAGTTQRFLIAVDKCDERYWYMTGIESNSAEIADDFLAYMTEQSDKIAENIH